MRSRIALISSLAVFIALLFPAAAHAGGPGTWTNISSNGDSIDEPGILRDGSGDLHVVWINNQTSSIESVWQSVISPTGSLSGKSAVVSNWATLQEDPALVPFGASGLRLAFSGIQNGAGGNPYNDGVMYTATSPDASTWTLSTGSLSHDSTAYAAYGADATTTAGGVPVIAYSSTGTSIIYHVGTSGTIPAGTSGEGQIGPFDYHDGYGQEAITNVALARDASSGDIYVGWYQWDAPANPTHDGYYVQKIYPSVGSPQRAPGSGIAAGTVSTDQKVGLSSRAGGGIYEAYCAPKTSASYDCAQIDLWLVGSGSPVVVPNSALAEDVALTQGSGGRLWVAWHTAAGKIMAVRTNAAATKFGTVVSASPPANTLSVYKLAGEGSLGGLDVIANVQTSTAGNPTTFWQTQILPGLHVVASPKKWSDANARTVTFTVTDAGTPVSGAKVSVAGKTATTNGSGVAKISFPKGFKTGKYKAKIHATGYATTEITLTVTH